MSVNHVAGHGPHSIYEGAQVLDPQLQLAILIGEHQDANIESDREALKAARDERRHQLEEEVKSLRAAASSVRSGALVSLGLTVSGQALQVAGELKSGDDPTKKLAEKAAKQASTPDSLKLVHIGAALSASAGTVSVMVTNEKGHEADGAAAKLKAEEASWRADDIKEHIRKIESLQDSILDRAAQTAHDTQSSNLSLINRI